MTPSDTPAVILLPDGAVLLSFPDGSALRIEQDGSVTIEHAVRAGAIKAPPSMSALAAAGAVQVPLEPNEHPAHLLRPTQRRPGIGKGVVTLRLE